jgi:hypothetical protein
MSIRFDDKGKFFTDVVAKESIPVIIQTPTNRIQGMIHVRPGSRLKDEINQSEPFFAVTEATIFDLSGEEQFHCEFMAINREHIIWLMPLDEHQDDELSLKIGEDA